ncbi:SDR family NAD(P)-dependent oxidoreductase, partial [Streptomyces olivaceus]|uniref:type I polyketide synthase n=2 Tax=Streptomyces olivaceus TaxID=47716 RepID=UPI0037B5BC02
RFADGITTLHEQGTTTFLELGPDGVLTALGQQILADTPGTGFVTLLRKGAAEPRAAAAALGRLFEHGVALNADGIFAGAGARRVDLPTYAFQHERYWLQDTAPTTDVTGAGLSTTGHPLLGAITTLPETGGVLATGLLSVRSHPWLADHTITGTTVVPGTALIDMVIRAGDETDTNTIEELVIEAPLTLPEADPVRVHIVIGPTDNQRRTVTLYSTPHTTTPHTTWTRHLTGTLTQQSPTTPTHDFHTWPPPHAEQLNLDTFYDTPHTTGLTYGPAFQGIRRAWQHDQDIYAEVTLPEQHPTDTYGIHPALLDAALQTSTLCPGQHTDTHQTKLPFAWNHITLHTTGATTLRVHATPHGTDTVSLSLADTTGTPVAHIGRMTLRPLTTQHLNTPHTPHHDSLYRTEWLPVADADAEDVPFAVLGTDVPDVNALGAGTPTVVIADLTESQATDGPGRALELAEQALELVQEWSAVPAVEASTLVLRTDGAASGDPAAAVWGLVRSAQTENPGRFVLVDADDRVTPQQIAAAAVSGEPQLMIRDATTRVPRLARVTETAGQPDRSFDPEGTVLVTGGLGTLGRLVARHLATEHGVRHLLLVSRRGTQTEGATELIEELAELGAQARIEACDVSDRTALRTLIDSVEHPLTAVIHTAGVLDDGVIAAQNRQRLEKVFTPKAEAAWHLHELTQDLNLSAFILYSSAAGTVGSAGQANYAAANGFLDALAEHRHSLGLPATSLAWGMWEQDGGMQDTLTHRDRERMSRSGMRALNGEEGLRLFDASLRAGDAVQVAARFDFAALRTRAGLDGVPTLLRALVRPARGVARSAGESSAGTLVERLTALPEEEQREALLDLVSEQAAEVLGFAGVGQVSEDQAFKDLGFDSLTAVELRNRLAVRAGVRLPATLVFDHPTPAALALRLYEALAPQLPRGTAPDEETTRAASSIGGGSTGDAPAGPIADMDVESLVARALSGSAN